LLVFIFYHPTHSMTGWFLYYDSFSNKNGSFFVHATHMIHP